MDPVSPIVRYYVNLIGLVKEKLEGQAKDLDHLIFEL